MRRANGWMTASAPPMSCRHPQMNNRVLRTGYPDHAGVKFLMVWMVYLALPPLMTPEHFSMISLIPEAHGISPISMTHTAGAKATIVFRPMMKACASGWANPVRFPRRDH